jgi:hypothetical protein
MRSTKYEILTFWLSVRKCRRQGGSNLEAYSGGSAAIAGTNAEEPMFLAQTHRRTALMNWTFPMERVTGIEPASRAWEPSNDALVLGLTCGQPWSGVTLVDRD